MIIESNAMNEIIINKSKFITYLYKVKSKKEFLNYYNELKRKYKDATHICYAYIINNEIKYSDDKEPNGSAGLPIYNVLKNNNLNYIACFVIRYFGGIKLGGSGLVKAYSNSASLCLKNTNIIEIEKLYKIKIIVDYNLVNTIENILDKKNILNKSFDNKIEYIVLVNDNIKNMLNSYNINYEIIEEDYL